MSESTAQQYIIVEYVERTGRWYAYVYEFDPVNDDWVCVNEFAYANDQWTQQLD